MGTADLVPGVSGGTMAFILGIYERLMQALKSLNSDALFHFVTGKWKLVAEEVDFKTLFSIGAGVLMAFYIFTQIVPLSLWYNAYKPRFLAFFFGMVFATVVIFLWQQKKSKFLRLVTLMVGVVIGVAITQMNFGELPNTRPYIFLSGMVAFTAMLLPGISGSYILLMLGKYETMLGALTNLHWPTISMFLAGGAIAVILFVRIISWGLKHYHGTVLMFITGLIAGTLPQLWPLPYMDKPDSAALSIVSALMVGGAAFIFLLHWLQVRLAD